MDLATDDRVQCMSPTTLSSLTHKRSLYQFGRGAARATLPPLFHFSLFVFFCSSCMTEGTGCISWRLFSGSLWMKFVHIRIYLFNIYYTIENRLNIYYTIENSFRISIL